MDYKPLKNLPDQVVILETDLTSDVDDVGAIAVLLDGAKRYGFKIGGISLNCMTADSVRALGTLLSSRGRTDVPIALCDARYTRPSPYLPALAAMCPGGLDLNVTTPEALYDEVLSGAKDGGVTVISVGFFQNIAAAHRRDPARFEKKVRTVVAMAGKFPNDPTFTECNVTKVAMEDAEYFSEHYRGRVIYSGFEIGSVVFTDLRSKADSRDPVAVAYGIFSKFVRESWDPLTVDFAIHGTSETYALSENGRTVFERGVTHFTPDPTGNSAYLLLVKTPSETSAHITEVIADTFG